MTDTNKVQAEPVAWLFQHEETGLTEIVDTQQVEWGFEKNNPRWQKISPLYTAPQPVQAEPVAKSWDEGYRAGVNDERMSEANIGIAGFGAKVEPARNNPYRTTPQRTWVGLTDEEINVIDAGTMFHEAPEWEMRFARAIEAKLKEKNT
jgi:hypothetical protein